MSDNKIIFKIIISCILFIGCSSDNNPDDDTIENTSPEIFNQEFFIDENIENGFEVGTITAADIDNDVLTFKLLDEEVPFGINENSGKLVVTDSDLIDYEAIESYKLSVEINDGELSSKATITIYINDIEESSLSAEEEARLFELATYVIFDKSDTEPNETTRKWIETVKLHIDDGFSDSDIEIINNFVITLQNLNTIGLEIELVDSWDEANVKMLKSDFDTLVATYPDFVSTSSTIFERSGTSRTSRSGTYNYIVSSNIWINSEKLKNSTLKHEFLHAIGIGHSNDQSSIMYYDSSVENLSEDDIFVIEALYSNEIQHNLNEEEFQEALKQYFLTL